MSFPGATLSRWRWRCAPLVAATVLGGCATYQPLPLGSPRGAASATHLSVSAASMPTPALAHYRFDPSDGLDATEVAMLAVANSPQLKVRRDDVGVASAQAFAAGLLPDPVLNLDAGFPSPRAKGLVSSYTFGLTEDLKAILLRPARQRVARHEAKKVNLDLLWAEWQTVAHARLLFDQVRTLRAQKSVLMAEQKVLIPLTADIQHALASGNLTYAAANAGLDAAANVRGQLATTTTALHKAGAQLRVLLGLAPHARLELTGPFYRPQPDRAQLDAALASLARRRPDLLALKAGYQAQDARLRQAILAQFPAITLGFTRARDTGNITTNGPTLSISLPIFDRNRGQIAIERATRQRLKDAYDARLLTTRSDMQRLHADIAALEKQYRATQAHAKQMDASRAAAERAWQQHILDWPTYLAIRSAALAADTELLNLREQIAEQGIALKTLLGTTGFNTPQVTSP
jgi:outer membrane protein TolC